MTANATSNHKLSTPVYKHMNGVESWDNASKDARIAFYGAMKGKAYGFEPTRSAWDWFLNGWSGRPAHETTSDVQALLTVQQENKRLRGALARISAGTPDLLPPYRADGASQLRDIAIKALQQSSPLEPTPELTVDATPSTGQGNTSWGVPVKPSPALCPNGHPAESIDLDVHKCDTCGWIGYVNGS